MAQNYLLILDSQNLNKDDSESIGNKPFVLSVLSSNSINYNTYGELNDSAINDLLNIQIYDKKKVLEAEVFKGMEKYMAQLNG